SAGLDAARKTKPGAFFEPALSSLVTPGNFEDSLARVAEVDWIIEAVVEDLAMKRTLLRKVEALRRPGTIVTTNTSGLPVAKIAEGFSDDFRRSWFGTHFFNPPRYMRLVEIIRTPETDPAAIEAISAFADRHLGKGVVTAKDTPNFIANRIGTFSVLNGMRLMGELELTIEEVDALTGPAVGWPRSGTFRTLDMVGLDILGHVVRNMENVDGPERQPRTSPLPAFFHKMLERKMLGDKTGGGFYKKVKGAGEDERLALDWKTLEYRPRQKAKFASLEMAKNVDNPAQRLRTLLGGSGKGKDERFLWNALADLWNYSANAVPEISDTIVEIDRAMRLGFNWEMGPFELWDAAGVEETVQRMEKEGGTVSSNVHRLLALGQKSWYRDFAATPSHRVYFDLASSTYQPVELPAGVWSVRVAKQSNGTVKKNSSASVVDICDGVACIEFHSKMN